MNSMRFRLQMAAQVIILAFNADGFYNLIPVLNIIHYDSITLRLNSCGRRCRECSF